MTIPKTLSGVQKAGVAAVLAVAALLVCLVAGAQWRVALFWCVFLSCAWLLWALRSMLMERPERLFLFLALPTGLLLCAFMPSIVSVSWDGYVHYKVANQIAQGETVTTTEADVVNYDMDGIYTVGPVPWGTSENDWDPNWAGVLTEEGMEKANGQFTVLSQSVHDVEENPLTWGLGTMGRLPNALGLWLGQVLGVPYLVRLFLGRVTNFLFWVLLVELAMSRLKSGKRVVCAVGLLPTALFEACNYSYDPWCIGLLLLAFASFVGELQRPDERLTVAGALWILVPFALGVLPKATWVPAGLALLFVPRKKFRTGAGRAWWCVACCAVAAGVLWTFVGPFLLGGGSGYSDTRGETLTSEVVNIGPSEQLAGILADPVHFVGVLALWLVSYLNPVPVFIELFVNFCYLPRPLLWPLWAAGEVLLLALVTLCDRSRADDGWPSRALRAGSIVGLVLAYCLSAVSLYLSYTNVGADYILGMQVRYLLLFLGPFLLLVLNLGTRGRAWCERHVLEPVKRRLPAGGGALTCGSAAYWLQAGLAWAVLLFGFLVRF